MCITRNIRPASSGWLWRKACAAALLSLGLGSPAAQAQDASAASSSQGISLHGFGTLGLTRANDDNAQLVRDLSQPNGAGNRWTSKVDSLLGLQANIYFNPDTEGVVQVVSRYHADSSYRPEVTWAFVRHDFSPDFSLRVGRLGTEFYMLGDSRLVGYSNLSVRPPPDFYGSLVFSYTDGLDFTLTRPVATGLLKGKLFAGRSPEETPYAPGIIWDLKGSQLVGSYLDYTSGPWQFRASHVRARFNQEMPVDQLVGMPYLSMVPEMSMAGQHARFSSLGLVYDQGPLNVQLMLNRIGHDSAAYASSRAAYVMAAYRLGEVTPYLGVSRSVSESPSIPHSPIPGVDDVTRSLISQSFTDQTTYTVGARWDLQKNLSLKAQVDAIRGKPSSVFLLKGTGSGLWDGNLTAVSLTLDFVF
ncbi:hypothetical protein HUU62_12215 [Rhodoferax sp. 4810]|nr:hypothetical protein [Rhodoferax jenense]